jgi:hypothetical protein
MVTPLGRRSSMITHFLLAATCLTASPGHAQSTPGTATPDPLLAEFRDPPQSARPRVWWHWMNGNITQDGIAKDLAWMKRIGIGGAQAFDASIATPQIVAKRLVYMTPQWKQAFSFAASEAQRLGLELAIASSAGWSETGGPWVRPEDGLKKVVWSETELVGGKRFNGSLPPPPSVTGPFQTLAAKDEVGSLLGSQLGKIEVAPYYADIAVLAVPVSAGGDAPPALFTDGTGKQVDAAPLGDEDLRSTVELTRGTADPSLVARYAVPTTVRSARLFAPGGAAMFVGASYLPKLEASDDGKAWRNVAELPLSTVPTTIGFVPVTARQFRVTFAPARNAAGAFAPPVQGLDLASIGSAFGGRGSGAGGLQVAEFRLFTEDRIDRVEAKSGFDLVPDYYALDTGLPALRSAPPSEVVDLTARTRADGTLDWTPPSGRWKVIRLGYSLTGTTNHPAPAEATGLEVDKFDGAAVRRYMEHYFGLYRDASGGLIGGRGVRAIVNDSIEVGAANWTPQMIEQFTRLRGYDPTPWLATLTGTIVGSRQQSDRFLYDYRRTLSDLIAREHYGTVAAVAHENGLKVYGEALEENRPVIGDDMAMRRHADIPMAAMWTYPREAGPKLAYIADIKGAASVAHVYGQNLVAAESLTALLAPWAFGPADLKRIVDLEFVLGVNRPVIHTSVHQPNDDNAPGVALSIFGQYFNRHEAWAELAGPWIDYLARNSLMLQQGRNVADVAYFYGEEAPLTGLFSAKPIGDAPRDLAYDFVNADALTGALANDGAELVTPGGARYRVLYLGGSSRQMTLPVLRRLAELVEGGATIIGVRPQGNPSLAGDPAEWNALATRLWPGGDAASVGNGRVIATSDIEAGLRAAGVTPDFRYAGGQPDTEIQFLHRKLADGDSYFLSNRKDRAEAVEARFRVTGKAPELWHAETGAAEPVAYRIENGETVVPLTLAPDDAVHVVFRKPARADARAIKKLEPVELVRLEGPWTVAFQPGRGAPETATFQALKPLDEHEQAGIKYFSGVATYTTDFATPQGWRRAQPLWLDLGEAREIAEVRINGKLAGSAWHAPYSVDIAALARPGRNRLEVRVANLWVNRLVGDAQPGATKIARVNGPTYGAKAPLRRSGLIGPVRLLGVR